MAPFVLRTFPLVTFVWATRPPVRPSGFPPARERRWFARGQPPHPGHPLRLLRERDGRPRGSPLRFELAAFYEVVEEFGVGYVRGDILLGVSWRLIRFHAVRSSFSWMEAHSMTRP